MDEGSLAGRSHHRRLIPLFLFVTLEVYDSFRYFTRGFNPSYAPWPLGSSIATSYSARETTWLAVSAVSLSLVIAGIDFLIGRANESTHDAVEARVERPQDVGIRLDVFITERLGLFTRSQARSRVVSLAVNGAPARMGRRS